MGDDFMNKVFMSGYYQGVVETAPATLSATKVEQLAVTMTILHLRLAGESVTTIHDFLANDIHADPRIINKYINLSANKLKFSQAQVMQLAFKE